jgi:undecaprenyl diphosphate synthase
MTIFADASERETRQLHANGVRIRHVGRMDRVPSHLQRAIGNAVELTRDNTRLTLNFAFNYGGRAEIVDAIKRIVSDGVAPEMVDEGTVSRYLYTADLPDPDLVIRTAGEMRLSNFLIWQAAYSEYYSTPKPWPDFDEEDLHAAVQSYASRHRKFGKL